MTRHRPSMAILPHVGVYGSQATSLQPALAAAGGGPSGAGAVFCALCAAAGIAVVSSDQAAGAGRAAYLLLIQDSAGPTN